jgi:hypothetical protein
MEIKKTKQLILDNLKKEESCFKDLVNKIEEQKKAIENKDDLRVLEIIEEKNQIIKSFHNLESEVNDQMQSLSPEETQRVKQEGKTLMISIEKLIETIIRIEEECEVNIGRDMKEVEKKIFRLQKGKKIGKGYGSFLKNRPLISRKI